MEQSASGPGLAQRQPSSTVAGSRTSPSGGRSNYVRKGGSIISLMVFKARDRVLVCWSAEGEPEETYAAHVLDVHSTVKSKVRSVTRSVTVVAKSLSGRRVVRVLQLLVTSHTSHYTHSLPQTFCTT